MIADDPFQVLLKERNALAAELAVAHTARIANFDAYRESETRIAALEAALRRVIDKQAHRGSVVLYEEDIDNLRNAVGEAREWPTAETKVAQGGELTQCDGEDSYEV